MCHMGIHNQKDVPSGPSDSLKLDGVELRHMVDVQLCVAKSSGSALGIDNRCSNPSGASLKLERRDTPSINFTVEHAPFPPTPIKPASSSPGGGRKQGLGTTLGWSGGSMWPSSGIGVLTQAGA